MQDELEVEAIRASEGIVAMRGLDRLQERGVAADVSEQQRCLTRLRLKRRCQGTPPVASWWHPLA
jgi:hypothetical protein